MKLSRKISISLAILSFILILFAGISLIVYYQYDPFLGNGGYYAGFFLIAVIFSLLSLPLSTASILIEWKYCRDGRTAANTLLMVILILVGLWIFAGTFIIT
jgi:hypothetical protein